MYHWPVCLVMNLSTPSNLMIMLLPQLNFIMKNADGFSSEINLQINFLDCRPTLGYTASHTQTLGACMHTRACAHTHTHTLHTHTSTLTHLCLWFLSAPAPLHQHYHGTLPFLTACCRSLSYPRSYYHH